MVEWSGVFIGGQGNWGLCPSCGQPCLAGERLRQDTNKVTYHAEHSGPFYAAE